jgi:hypothetical protein
MGAKEYAKSTSARQDRRWFLMQRLLLCARARLRDLTKRLGQAAVGALTIGILRTARYFDPICVFRQFPDTDFGNSRTAISVIPGQRFR